jgi:hypothetical protein
MSYHAFVILKSTNLKNAIFKIVLIETTIRPLVTNNSIYQLISQAKWYSN